MNPVLEVIKTRRSVRSYRTTPVPKDLTEAIIDAGNQAPSGHNRQRWRFVVVEDEEFRQKLTNAALPAWRRVVGGWMNNKDKWAREFRIGLGSMCLGWPPLSYEETISQLVDMEDGMYWGAPLVIFVIGTASIECAMACQNMMLAAHSLGLGSCIVGFGANVTHDPEIVEALELPVPFRVTEKEKIVGALVFGYPEIHPEPPKKKPPVVKWI